MSAALRPGALLLVALLLAAGLSLIAWPEQQTPAEVKAEAASFVSAFSVPASSPAYRPAPPPSPQPAAPAPPGLTATRWAQLQAELAAQPGGEAELRRLFDYFTYADALERFRRLRADRTASRELPALARQLDLGLPDRLQRREISVHEAQQIKTALLEVLVPEASQRRHQLALWRQAQVHAAGGDPQAAAREAEFQRRQAALVAAWSARPPLQRDPKVLEAELEALRRASFPAPER